MPRLIKPRLIIGKLLNFRSYIVALLVSCLTWAPFVNGQVISVDVLGVGVDIVVPGASNAQDDISALSMDILGSDAALLSGQDILLLGAPTDGIDSAIGDTPLTPLVNGLSGAQSSVIEFLQGTAADSDIAPQVLTIDISDGAATEAAPQDSVRDDRKVERRNIRLGGSAPGRCVDRDRDSVCDSNDRCPSSPVGAVVLPSGCHFDTNTPLELYGVNFATNTAVLSAASTAVLRQAARILAAVPDIRVEVVGHTDDVGSKAFNMSLSKQRAKAVIDFLVAEGISAGRFEYRGLGESSPKIPVNGLKGDELDAARAENRRVELRALK